MKRLLVLLLTLGVLTTVTTSCESSGGGSYSSGGGGTYYDDPWEDDYYYDDSWDDYDDSWDDYDDSWDDDSWDDDWSDDSWDDDWDYDDDDCWDCGDDWGWYDDAQATHDSSDIMGSVAEKSNKKMEKISKFFSNKFNLSDDHGKKIAKTVTDFSALKKRDASDLAEFAQKLYGLNTEEIVTSIASAQVGDYSKLDSAVEKAAKNFNTTPENMRLIIKDLHNTALKDNGIEL